MKIFKYRGDIYFSKVGHKNGKEEKFLIFCLVLIVAFTAAFLTLLSMKYSTIAEFFTGISEDSEIVSYSDLPEIEGKYNYLIFETDDEESTIHYVFLFQADGDNLSYKVTTLLPTMKIDEKSLYEIFSTGGGSLLKSEIASYLGVTIDYYANFNRTNFIEFSSELGTFVYNASEAVKFSEKNDDEEDEYAIRISAGENRLEGKDLCNLMRYYSCESVDLNRANELMLSALVQLFNVENLENAQSLFKIFINDCSTNITIYDYEQNSDKITVFATRFSDVTVYSALAEYDDNTLTSASKSNIKGYFATE